MCIAGLFCPSVLIPGLSLSFRSSSPLSDCMAASCRPSPRGGKAKDEAKLFSYFSQQNKAIWPQRLLPFDILMLCCWKTAPTKYVKSRAPVGGLFSTSTREMRPRSSRSMLGKATGASDWAEGGGGKPKWGHWWQTSVVCSLLPSTKALNMSPNTKVKTRVGRMGANSEIVGLVFGIFCEKLEIWYYWSFSGKCYPIFLLEI